MTNQAKQGLLNGSMKKRALKSFIHNHGYENPRGKSFEVILNDEIPPFGSGYRRIRCISYGRKWARLFYAPLNKRVRIRRNVFDNILKSNKTVELSA